MQGRNKCWALNGQQFQPEVKGLRGLLRTYRSGHHGAPSSLLGIVAYLSAMMPQTCYVQLPRRIWQMTAHAYYCQLWSVLTCEQSFRMLMSEQVHKHSSIINSSDLICVMSQLSLNVATCCQDILTRNTVSWLFCEATSCYDQMCQAWTLQSMIMATAMEANQAEVRHKRCMCRKALHRATFKGPALFTPVVQAARDLVEQLSLVGTPQHSCSCLGCSAWKSIPSAASAPSIISWQVVADSTR